MTGKRVIPPGDSWSERLEKMSSEMRMLEQEALTENIEVKTYPEKTVVTLTYEH
jgi:hypothetical protein